jgi:ribonuclease PH
VEVQGTAETKPYTRQTLDAILTLAEKGIRQLFQVQQAAIERLK